jgi:ferric-dicitrate binding protein FerR (iron transport regulator)
MNEEKLIGYIKEEITSKAELVEILDWIESSSENQKQYNQLKNLWVLIGLDYPDKVVAPPFSIPEAKGVFFQKRILLSSFKYAAVFILAFALGSISLYFGKRDQNKELSSVYNTIEVPNGERAHISLYDGTKVWLNSGTKFRYPVAFNSNTREVFIEGEAYFDVAKDRKHPFVVNAGQLKVEVLGTRFNICAYPEDNEFLTTLEEGSVKADNTVTGRGVVLHPGQQVSLNRKANGLKLYSVNTELYTFWKENLLKFEDATFEDVVKKMERWYDVKISVDPAINTGERYTMTIKTESLREMLQLVSKTTKMNYEIEKNNVYIKKP